MSVWASVGPTEIATRRYEHSGHLPTQRDEAGTSVTVAHVPRHLTDGVWVRLGVGDLRVVLGRRSATQLRDALTAILAEPGHPPEAPR